MNKIKAILIVLALFGIGLFLYKNNVSRAIPETVTVVITEEGFYPSKVLISKGDTVTWINKGKKLHWPASNSHPTHNLYPEGGGCLGSKFDACKGLEAGESYSFTFDIVGIWAVHDHLYPGFLMTIQVVQDKKTFSKKLYVYNKNTKIEDFRKFNYEEQLNFIESLSSDNPKKAWAYLKQAFVIDGKVVGNAHDFSHIIGNKSYKKSGLKGIEICDETFAFGCFHGVTEAMLLKEGVKKIKDIEDGCLSIFPPQISQGYTGCIHGMGHGIFTWEGGDIKKSLSDCDSVTENHRQYCYEGVFMENSSQPESRFIDVNNPWKLCSSLDERYSSSCAKYQSNIFLNSFSKEVDPLVSAGAYCALATNDVMKEVCYRGLGFFITQRALGNKEIIIDKCNDMPNKNGIEICMMGGALETVFQQYGDFKNSATELCNMLSESKKTFCLGTINNMLEQYVIKN